MRRYWLSQELKPGDEVEVGGDSFKHIVQVCRQKQGSKFELLTEQSKAFLVTITSLGKKSFTAKVLEEREIPAIQEPHLHLCLSLPKFNKVDEIVEKSVELGVKEISLFTSDYSFVGSPGKVDEKKLKRWQRIIVSATQQCGRGDLLQLNAISQLPQLLENINREQGVWGLFPYEGESSQSLSQELKSLKTHAPRQIMCFVGSEGGFSTQEVELFKNKGLEPVSLGQQVLRVETACVAILSVIKYEMDLML